MYPLPEVLLLCLLAVLAGAETVTDIARFGDAKLALLRRFRPFTEGTPAHDHLGDILAALDAESFQRCFAAWAASLVGNAGRPAGCRSRHGGGSDLLDEMIAEPAPTLLPPAPIDRIGVSLVVKWNEGRACSEL